MNYELDAYSTSPYERWGLVAELTCHLQNSTPYGIRFSQKTYRPSPTKDVTWKDPPLIKRLLTGEVYCIHISIYTKCMS
jgi:hypothetical protein